ncbi:hypothetical protein JSY14_02230 [Brachybacterium sp. EF45031]|uniref:hypothetical protein n=1 Tax=Brachybacterium sillae TaxID=2810536 RepID=UPI00217D6F98|nr:hypothetical protein [Brachybacterium sillae]MCS6710892.1 hypothetical protein [Brachybacterium sillae]
MSVDPHIDYLSHDPEDGDTPSDNPEIRKVQELEKRMREALATKDNPMHDNERTIDRLRRSGFDDPIEDAADDAQDEAGAGDAR